MDLPWCVLQLPICNIGGISRIQTPLMQQIIELVCDSIELEFSSFLSKKASQILVNYAILHVTAVVVTVFHPCFTSKAPGLSRIATCISMWALLQTALISPTNF
jgi:hypothetical protein